MFVWLWVFIGLFLSFQSMQAKILGEMPQHICSVFIFQGRRQKKRCYWVLRGEEVQCVNFSKQLRIHTKEKYLIKVPHNLGHFNWNLQITTWHKCLWILASILLVFTEQTGNTVKHFFFSSTTCSETFNDFYLCTVAKCLAQLWKFIPTQIHSFIIYSG